MFLIGLARQHVDPTLATPAEKKTHVVRRMSHFALHGLALTCREPLRLCFRGRRVASKNVCSKETRQLDMMHILQASRVCDGFVAQEVYWDFESRGKCHGPCCIERRNSKERGSSAVIMVKVVSVPGGNALLVFESTANSKFAW